MTAVYGVWLGLSQSFWGPIKLNILILKYVLLKTRFHTEYPQNDLKDWEV